MLCRYKNTKYLITSDGYVFDLDKNCYVTLSVQNGYLAVTMFINGEKYNKRVHRLVAECFIPNTQNKLEVNHIDGNKKNNKVSNLEWVTRKENMSHASVNELLNTKEITLTRKQDNKIFTFNSRKEASVFIGCSQTNLKRLEITGKGVRGWTN